MKKYYIVVVSILILLVAFFTITDTYGLFESKVILPSKSELAAWNIKVNNSRIGKTEEFKIDDVIWKNNEYVKDGVAAPGSTGSFDIVIDTGDTGVAFYFEVEINIDDVENEMFKITSIEEKNGHVLVRTGKNTYSSIVRLKDIGDIYDIKVELEWVNDDDNSEVDTKYTNDGKTISFPIKASFYQYLNDYTLVEYTESE